MSENDEKKTDVRQPETEKIDDLKILSAIGYLGILFLVPYLAHPESKFAVFHANQGLLLFILAVAVNILGSAIPFLGWFIILPLGNIFTLVLLIMGVINAMQGTTKRLPLIGTFDILKVKQ